MRRRGNENNMMNPTDVHITESKGDSNSLRKTLKRISEQLMWNATRPTAVIIFWGLLFLTLIFTPIIMNMLAKEKSTLNYSLFKSKFHNTAAS